MAFKRLKLLTDGILFSAINAVTAESMIEGVRFVGGLADKKCKPCEGGVEPLDLTRANILLSQVPGWELSRDGKSIQRGFRFEAFPVTMLFINAIAWVANRQGHHPDLKAGYGYCNVTYTTHAIRGLSENDFICAYQINALAEP